jgi:hypothetical protein
MAFGKTFYINFPEEFRQHVKNAVQAEQVKWDRKSLSLLAGSGAGQFDWAECTWQLEEIFEEVTSITLIKGNINEEAIIIAKLKNGNTYN